MSKHTYGFHTDRDKDEAVADAIKMASEVDGGLALGKPYTTEILETDEHIQNGEFVVVVRVAE